ncbi:MAG: type III-A CRISPR-associated RAMP protein Csm3 [Arcobacteraceae bacterium]|jgi:CRISPR-associated protein Csm3|nr:type III-A CRISPR-associated RAMP protein Csm3 [Arcobacteraceae bacterium]
MKILTLTANIELLSGLHIGGGDDTMKIGGIDNQVIKDINSGEPYIPGSSIKGKMRSLLEWNGKIVGVSDGKPFGSDKLDKIIDETDKQNAKTLIKLFGDSNPKSSGKFGITRISVADAKLIKIDNQVTSEAKYENTINRQNGIASNPRQTERVPAGVKFVLNIRVKVLDDDSEAELKNMVEKGLDLIENDYLGGNGSRGYGRVEFIAREWKEI